MSTNVNIIDVIVEVLDGEDIDLVREYWVDGGSALDETAVRRVLGEAFRLATERASE